MTNDFRKQKIIRNCNKEYQDYHSFKPYLQRDFNHRCAYCDMNDAWVLPLPYQIDHFIPRVAFEKQDRTDLENDYRNLMYACPICNRMKSGKFHGKIPKYDINNPFFYNPVDVDYNTIFERDEKGRICSHDGLGKEMIKQLQLYRPTKQMAWFLDELKQVDDGILAQIDLEIDPKKKEILEKASEKIGNALYRRHQVFVHSFMEEKKK